MAMSDDPRYRRGQSGNQRPLQGQDEMRGRGESRNERPARNYSGTDTSGERPGAAGGKTPTFSAYRPEAYASSEKRGARQDWEEPRAAPPRAQSPAAEAFPRPAPERPGTQHDPRDAYQDTRDFYRGGVADPYAAPANEQEWRPSSYQDSKPSYQESKPNYPESKPYYPESKPYQNPPSYADTPSYPDTKAGFDKAGYPDTPAYDMPAYQDNKYPGFYDETPPEPDVQDTHNHFFAEPEAPQQRFRGNDYGNSYDEPHEVPAYAPPAPPAQRGNFAAPAWDEHAPAPASLRPYQAPAVQPHAREDEVDDYFADEDEFENEDFPEEKKSGRTKLIAAVLVGAIVTGGGLAYLYKTSSNRGADGGVPLVEANSNSFKETRNDPGRKFPATKPIQARLVEGESDAPSPGAVTTTSNGSLEERINKALQDAKGNDGRSNAAVVAASEPANSGQSDGDANASPDTPQSVKTVRVNPDGSFGGDASPSGYGRRAAPAAAAEVVTTAANTDAESAPTPTTRSISGTRLASATPASHTPLQEIPEAPVGTGQFFVQVGARNDQAQALAAFNTMQQKYSSVLGNYSPSIRKADLGDKGIWYRLRVGPFQDKPSADKLCEDLKTAGWKQCFSVKD